MPAKKTEYFKIPFTGQVITKTALSNWFRQNKFTVVANKNTLILNRRTAVDPVQVADEIQDNFSESKRTSNISLNIKGIAVEISTAIAGNAGQANEFYLVNTINHYCEVLGPIDIEFVDKRGKEFILKRIVEAHDVGHDVSENKKADIILVDKNRRGFPISLKQDNASFFGSIDAKFKDLMKKAVNYAISKRLLEKHEFKNNENRINPHIALEPTDEEQEFFLFGSDIIKKHGAIIKQSFKKDDFSHVPPNKIIIKVEKIWQSLKDFDERDMAAIEIRNQTGRNRSDKEISGLRILATIRSKIPKNAIWLDREAFA